MKYFVWLLTALIALPATAQFRPSHRYTLTAGHVAQSIAGSLAQRGIIVDGSQVSLLSNVTARTPDPALEVSSVESLPELSKRGKGESRSAVRISCHAATDCLPFYAIVRWHTDPSSETTVAQSTSFAKPAAMSKAAPQLVIHAGAHATLILKDGGMQIQLSVVSLENGTAGQKIRVAGSGNRQVYLAEVVNPTLLQGAL